MPSYRWQLSKAARSRCIATVRGPLDGRPVTGEDLRGIDNENGASPVRRVGKKLPQVQAPPDFVFPRRAPRSPGFENPRMRQAGPGVARDVDDAAALEREVVGHGPMNTPGP